MRVILIFALLLFSATAFGQAQLNCYSSERFGGTLVRVGDSERRVIEQNPDREVQLENALGGAAGFRFDFYKRERTVQIYVQSGVVIRICSTRE